MNEIAISLRNISKKYKLFNFPKERLFEALHPFNKKYHREFWALKDISIDIHKGQTVGIIGRNGSGKSTLLQVICSILRPTSGSITVNGRISALLELGAGFNPEFTGRDNVFLNGALMGFSREEMKERMPVIEAFADIGEFIDQPVKIYSSGMFVRLAFAAAINVDPDILVVDEALAVGDAKFQHKCYQKFLDFQQAGRTIILVTHDTSAILKHCDHAFLLENGAVMESGKPNDVVNHYYKLILTEDSIPGNISFTSTSSQQKPENSALEQNQSELERFFKEAPTMDNCIYRNSYNKNEYRFGDKRAVIVDYLVVSGEKHDPVTVYSGDMVNIYLKARFHQTVDSPMFGFSIKTIDGVVVYASNTRYSKIPIKSAKESDIIVFSFSIKLSLIAGDFFIDLGIAEKLPGIDSPIDIRYSLIHLPIQERNRFDGFVELESSFQEILRNTTDKVII
ncbi:ABC transporter ATP-binding protein [bacterium]|nr:ABC transporter ATP-binding protein [bacterium]